MSSDALQPTQDGRVLRARALREERRMQLLNAAHSVFAQKGYHNASIQDIIQAAGVARGTFYLYFESKRAIFEEILDDLLAAMRACLRGIDLQSSLSPEAQLQANLLRILQVLVRNEDMPVILLRQAVGLDEDFDNKLAEFYAHIVEIIQVALTIGMGIGLVRSLDAAVVSRCILGGVKEVLSAALIDSNANPPDLERLTAEIVEYNLVGVVRR